MSLAQPADNIISAALPEKILTVATPVPHAHSSFDGLVRSSLTATTYLRHGSAGMVADECNRNPLALAQAAQINSQRWNSSTQSFLVSPKEAKRELGLNTDRMNLIPIIVLIGTKS